MSPNNIYYPLQFFSVEIGYTKVFTILGVMHSILPVQYIYILKHKAGSGQFSSHIYFEVSFRKLQMNLGLRWI
jgi:hypothetical protein